MKIHFSTNCYPVVFLVIIPFLSSCTHYYYGPNSVNVPMLHEKGEAVISAGISGADETTGFELQSAYAFGKNFGAMFNFYAAGGKDNTTFDGTSGSGSQTFEKGNGNLTEIGFGYFSGPKKSNLNFEVYGGIGGGTVSNYYANNDRSRVGLTRLFVQPSLGYSNDQRTLEVAFSTRLSNVTFNVKEKRFGTSGSVDQEQVADIENNRNIPFFEPSFLFRGGGRNIKAQVQLTTSHPLKQKSFLTQGTNLSFGILFALSSKPQK